MESEIRRERNDSTDIDFLHIYFYLHFCKEQEALESVTSLICFFLFVTSIIFLTFFYCSVSLHKVLLVSKDSCLANILSKLQIQLLFQKYFFQLFFYTTAGRIILLIWLVNYNIYKYYNNVPKQNIEETWDIKLQISPELHKYKLKKWFSF